MTWQICHTTRIKNRIGTGGRKRLLRELEPREGVAMQTRAEQNEIDFIRAVDAFGETWLVTRTAN